MARSSRAGIKKGMKNVKKFEKASAKDLRKDVKETSSVIDAAFGNASTAHKGAKKRLGKYNSRQMDRVLAMKERMNAAGKRDVRRVKSREEFGTMDGMLEGTYTRSTKNAEAGAKTGDVVAASGKRLVDDLDETSRTAITMMKYGAQEARAGADQALAEAQAVRAKVDAETAAQMRHELQLEKIRIQAAEEADARALANQKKILRFQDRLASDTLGQGPASQIRSIADTYTSLANDMYQTWQKALQSGEPVDEYTLYQTLMANYPDIAASNAAKARALWLQLTTNTEGVSGHEELVTDISDFLMRNIRGVPGWEDLGKGKGKKDRSDIIDKWVRNIVGTGMASAGTTTGIGGNPEKGDGKPISREDDGYVGRSYVEVRKAMEAQAEVDLGYEIEPARETTINWFRDNAEAMLKDAMPETGNDVVADIVDAIIDGKHWDAPAFGPNGDRQLPAEARAVIRRLFMTLPKGDDNYGRNIFEFEWYEGS